jgi:hypothetical protein
MRNFFSFFAILSLAALVGCKELHVHGDLEVSKPFQLKNTWGQMITIHNDSFKIDGTVDEGKLSGDLTFKMGWHEYKFHFDKSHVVNYSENGFELKIPEGQQPAGVHISQSWTKVSEKITQYYSSCTYNCGWINHHPHYCTGQQLIQGRQIVYDVLSNGGFEQSGASVASFHNQYQFEEMVDVHTLTTCH